ncbi:MAG: HPr family phosphocarrier protein [Alphaproteobacteria bacterium]|nr:HPr family phosphocarrier protein [Alphaproteobacteria bacterium]
MTSPNIEPNHDQGAGHDSVANSGKFCRQLVEITNSRGLHARAAAKFVKTAAPFQAEILVRRCEKSDLSCAGEQVSGRSIMGLMMLAAPPGTWLELFISGNDAKAACDALTILVQNRFDEE